jgi:hypothetical protein
VAKFRVDWNITAAHLVCPASFLGNTCQPAHHRNNLLAHRTRHLCSTLFVACQRIYSAERVLERAIWIAFLNSRLKCAGVDRLRRFARFQDGWSQQARRGASVARKPM